MEVRRNMRFQIGQKIELIFNPTHKLLSGTVPSSINHTEKESFVSYEGFSGSIVDISVNDIIANKYFGGRVAHAYSNSIAIGVTYDTFAEEISTYMKGYNAIDSFIFPRKDTADYFYCDNGSGYIAESGGSDGNRILDCFISEQMITTNNQRFGYGESLYGSGWEDRVKIVIPASIPEWKLQQLLNSEAVAMKGDNNIYVNSPTYSEYDTEYDAEYGEDVAGSGDWETIDYYNYYVQYGGGSCSPIIRLITFDGGTFSFNKRRNMFEVEAVIKG